MQVMQGIPKAERQARSQLVHASMGEGVPAHAFIVIAQEATCAECQLQRRSLGPLKARETVLYPWGSRRPVPIGTKDGDNMPQGKEASPGGRRWAFNMKVHGKAMGHRG
jgi:TPP-dependent 2-oxoacid decarboxylase